MSMGREGLFNNLLLRALNERQDFARFPLGYVERIKRRRQVIYSPLPIFLTTCRGSPRVVKE